jgi:hypothetical protein
MSASPSKAASSSGKATSSKGDDSPGGRPMLKKAQSMKVVSMSGKGNTSPMVGRGKRSSKSPDPPPQSKQQTQEQIEADQKAAVEAERARQHEAWVKSNCTKLKIIYVDRSEKNVVIDAKMTSYAELQRHIARHTPKSSAIFAVYDHWGENIVR